MIPPWGDFITGSQVKVRIASVVRTPMLVCHCMSLHRIRLGNPRFDFSATRSVDAIPSLGVLQAALKEIDHRIGGLGVDKGQHVALFFDGHELTGDP